MRAKPLWNYAVQVYPPVKTELLHWQDAHSLVVNDLIVMSFVAHFGLSLPQAWWDHPHLIQVRELIKRVRQLRRSTHNAVLKSNYLSLEIQCEAIDIAILTALVDQDTGAESDMIRYAQAHSLNDNDLKAVTELVGRLPLGLRTGLNEA